jgi:hypothetical protein
MAVLLAAAGAGWAEVNRAKEWWPERAAFKSCGGQYRETPSPEGCYVYDAENAVVFSGPGRGTPVAQRLQAYEEGLKFLPVTGDGLAGWNLGAIRPGYYGLGLQVGSGNEERPHQAECHATYTIRANGVFVDFTSMDAPVYVGANAYAAEMKSGAPVYLKPGDRVTVAGSGGWPFSRFVGQLKLYPGGPRRGPIIKNPGYVPSWISDGRTEFWRAHCYAVLQKTQESATATYWVENRANGPQRVGVSFRVTDYYGMAVTNWTAQHDLADGQWAEGKFDFPVSGEAPRYLVAMTVTGADGRPKTRYAFLGTPVTKGRHTVSPLPGPWLHARIPKAIRIGDSPPPDAKWEPYSLGSVSMGSIWMQDPILKHTHVAWVKTGFEVPPWMKEKRVILRFASLYCEAVVYVNGQKVGQEYGPGLPCAFDVTDALKPAGANELLVGLRDWISMIDQKALEAHGPEWTTSPSGLALAPGISINANPSAGIGGAWLENRPAVAVDSVYAIPSVRKQKLDLELTLVNAEATDREIAIAPVVKDAGKPVLALPETAVTLKARESALVRTGKPFVNPHLWSPADAHLYELAITVRDRKDNQVIEEHRSRFGFREFYAENGLFMLNGTPAKLLSNIPKEAGGLIERAEPPEYQLDQADETGHMYKHNGFCGGPSEFNLASDLYWRNATDFNRRLVLARRNRPCIAYWSPANEFACFAATTSCAEECGGREVAYRRLYAMGLALREVDPARPVEFDSDDDLGGRWDTLSLHYPRDDAPFRPNLYLPDCYLFRPMAKPLKPGETYELGFPNWGHRTMARYREKPILASEIGQFSLGVAHDVTLIGGEEPYASNAAATGYWQTSLDRYMLDGVRDIEVTFCHPWEQEAYSGTTKISYPLRYVVALDYTGHWRSGERVDFQCNIHHDVPTPEPMAVEWSLTDPAGMKAARGVLADRVFQPSELLRTRIRFNAPKAKAETRYRFVLEVRQGGQTVFSRDENFVVYPKRQAKTRVTSHLGIYDPERKSQAALALLGVEPKAVALADPGTWKGLDVLLIGQDALTEEAARQAGPALLDFVKQGGKVVVFEQTRPARWAAWLPYRVLADTDRISSFAFPRAADHPILNGIALEDLRLWRADRVVSRHDYLKPERGNFLSVIDAGGTRGLEWTPLLEVYFGKGSYLLCQLCLTEKAAADPCAARTLANLLEYVGGKALYRQPDRVVVLAATDSALAGFVGKLQTDVALSPPGAGPAGSKRLLVDAAAAWSDEQAQAVVNAARAGGTVILHGITPNTVAVWSKALGARLELRAVPAYYSAMAVRRDWHPLLTGLSMHELHWRQRAGGDSSSFEDWAKLGEIAKTEIATDAPGARLCTYPNVFVAVPCGQGEVVIDQMRWDTAGETVGPFCRRIGGALLANLGAGFEAMPMSRTVERPLAYVPLDLSNFVNRPMADDVGFDKEGGWSDQGSQIDGREFPSGRVVAKSVPFLIGGEKEQEAHDKTIIVFSISPDPVGRRFREQMTEVKGIPVHRKVETLNFLHTGAWMFPGHVLSYLVNYEDGSQEEIRVVSGINITDWAAVAGGELPKFPDEMPGITTQVGLVAGNPTFKAIAVYLMEWVNPHPDRAVATIDMVAPFRSHLITPIVMGITLGVKPADVLPTDPAPKGDRAKAEALVKQSEGLIAAGKYPDAEALLKEAAAADPSYGRAYYLLARVCRDTKNEKDAVKYCQKAAGLLPENTEVLNELGALLEAQGKTVQALVAYRQSLEVNWNQPPILQAVTRLK